MSTMSPGFSRSAALRMAWAEPVPPKIEIASTWASGADAGDADRVAVAADHADDGGAVVAPRDVRRLGATDDAALALDQVLVAEAPRALDVHDPHALTTTARAQPPVAGVHATRAGSR